MGIADGSAVGVVTLEELSGGLERLGVPASVAQIECLLQWLRLLDRWNAVFNLTAVPAARRAVRLGLMSAAAVPYLRARRVLDVGSGAGVPGIPLAVLAPDNDYTLLDSNRKKTRFLTQCRLELGLENVRVEHARVETFAGPPFDTIISRAWTQLDAFFSRTGHLTHADTTRLAFKSATAADEVQRLPADRAKWQFRRLHVPSMDQPTTLAVLHGSATDGNG